MYYQTITQILKPFFDNVFLILGLGGLPHILRLAVHLAICKEDSADSKCFGQIS